MLKYFQEIARMLQQNKELLVFTIVIIVVCVSTFIYLIVQWRRSRKAKRVTTPKAVRHERRTLSSGSITPTAKIHTVRVAIPKEETKIETPGSNAVLTTEKVQETQSSKTTITVSEPGASYTPTNKGTSANETMTKEIQKNVIKQPIQDKPVSQTPVTANKKEPSSPTDIRMPSSPPVEIIKPSTTNPTTKTEIGKEADVEDVTFINYKPNTKYNQPQPWTYPYVKMPIEGSVVRIPHRRRRQLRGYTEANFQQQLEKAFNRFLISGEDGLPTSGTARAYEPDISLVIREHQLNLFIDIEIDEPYAGIKRTPMHCLGYDDIRDAYFTDRGWMVIRFTERQIALQSMNCLAFIARVVHSVYPGYVVPAALQALSDPAKEYQWTSLQAQKWANANYREQYLGINAFGITPVQDTNVALTLNVLDKKTEAKVITSVIMKPDTKPAYTLNVKNQHERDRRIRFMEEGHVYLVDGVHAKSVTEIIEDCFPIFDSVGNAARMERDKGYDANELLRQWERERIQAAELGTNLHLCIEKHYHGESFDQPDEFEYFLNFHKDHEHLKPFRTEWRVFDEYSLVAGTIDLIVDNADDTYDIYDWKRSKKVVDFLGAPIKTDRWGNTGYGIFSSIEDTSYNRYCLQQSVYKLILEKHYNVRVRNMHLVVMHPSLNRYYKVTVEPQMEFAQHLISRNY